MSSFEENHAGVSVGVTLIYVYKFYEGWYSFSRIAWIYFQNIDCDKMWI